MSNRTVEEDQQFATTTTVAAIVATVYGKGGWVSNTVVSRYIIHIHTFISRYIK